MFAAIERERVMKESGVMKMANAFCARTDTVTKSGDQTQKDSTDEVMAGKL